MSDESEEGDVAERLMSTLISKMESMDSDLQVLKAENAALKNMVRDPAQMLRKAGFVRATTSMPRDVEPDVFRNDVGQDDLFFKSDELSLPTTNEGFHNTSWDDIHALAEQAKN